MLTLIIGALMQGSVYGLVGMGYGLIYKASGLMSLAQGDMLMIGFIGRAEADELRLSGEVNAAQWVDPAVAATLVVPKTPDSPVHMLLDLQRTLSGAET